MKILKTSILFFAFFIGSICHSQEKDIDNIIFEYNSFLGIPFNSIKIQIYKTVDGKNAFAYVQSETENDDSESQYSKIEASYDIDIEKFNNLIMKVVFLEKIDLDKAYLDGTDASTCKIEFGAKGRNISYEFWEPKFETKERGLNLFVELCEEILTLFKLNPKEFLDK